jgi:hypothetical protein
MVFNETLAVKGDRCKSFRNSKERSTVLLVASVTGEKLPPAVIGKVYQLRCFKNTSVNRLQLPVDLMKWLG